MTANDLGMADHIDRRLEKFADVDIELVCRLGADAAAAHQGGVAMSFYALCASILIADPRRREGAKGVFATATLKLPPTADDDAILVNVIAFGDKATQLPDFVWDEADAISGRTRPRRWTRHDGSVHHGLSLVAEQGAGGKPKRMAVTAPRTRPKPRQPSLPVAPLPNDDVSDLWREEALGL